MNATDTDTSRLEDLLENECDCESEHSSPINAVCSGAVVARKHRSCRGTAINICANSRDWNLHVMHVTQKRCRNCMSIAKDCWTIIPV